MKNILLILLTLFAFQGFAQDKTENISLKLNSTYVNVKLTAEDTLTSNLDTADYKIKYWSDGYIKKVSLHIGADTIAGADTISVQLLGYDFEDDAAANTIIAADTTNVASSSDIILSDDYFDAADEFSFRYYTIRIIRIGEGEGLLLNQIEFKVYTE